MKKILITGKNSYVGNAFENWIAMWPNEYVVDKISIRNDEWRNIDFGKYDSILHVAGIAHQDTKADQKELYYRINRDLTIEIAKKAKEEGVGQFIFLSSIIVYGTSSNIEDENKITETTIPNPTNFYGKSKLEAEKGIEKLSSKSFKIAIVRPPMIYGENSRGNYPVLSKYSKKIAFFPNINNKRSIIYIKNLCELLRLIIENNEKGMFFPQNYEYISTTKLVEAISILSGKHLYKIKIFNRILKILSKKIVIINKIFGNLYYEKKMSNYYLDYNIYSFNESIIDTEGINNKVN